MSCYYQAKVCPIAAQEGSTASRLKLREQASPGAALLLRATPSQGQWQPSTVFSIRESKRNEFRSSSSSRFVRREFRSLREVDDCPHPKPCMLALGKNGNISEIFSFSLLHTHESWRREKIAEKPVELDTYHRANHTSDRACVLCVSAWARRFLFDMGRNWGEKKWLQDLNTHKTWPLGKKSRSSDLQRLDWKLSAFFFYQIHTFTRRHHQSRLNRLEEAFGIIAIASIPHCAPGWGHLTVLGFLGRCRWLAEFIEKS